MVLVRISLREFSHDGWLVQGDLPLDAGQLEQTAGDLVTFFG